MLVVEMYIEASVEGVSRVVVVDIGSVVFNLVAGEAEPEVDVLDVDDVEVVATAVVVVDIVIIPVVDSGAIIMGEVLSECHITYSVKTRDLL